jgi:methyl coenzyme M reductase subunit C
MFPSDLTLRDYIAVHAMQGLMTLHPNELAQMQKHEVDINLSAMVSRIAYKVADEMLKERTNDKTQSGSSEGFEEYEET